MFLINLNAEIVACILSFRKSRHKPNLESTSKYGFFPRFGGKKWRRSEHAHASYPGLFFRPPGFSPYMGREKSRVQGLDYESGYHRMRVNRRFRFEYAFLRGEFFESGKKKLLIQKYADTCGDLENVDIQKI